MANINDSSSAGLFRIGGAYGQALRDGNVLADVVEVAATVSVNRIDVPLVGTTRSAYKPGRETREGTINIQKIDSTWELELRQFLAQNLATRRANRGTPGASLRPFSLNIQLDDPDALGIEEWQLDGCLFWQMDLGFNIGDDILNRSFPFTWEKETPLHTFKVSRTTLSTTTGLPDVTIVDSVHPVGG